MKSWSPFAIHTKILAKAIYRVIGRRSWHSPGIDGRQATIRFVTAGGVKGLCRIAILIWITPVEILYDSIPFVALLRYALIETKTIGLVCADPIARAIR